MKIVVPVKQVATLDEDFELRDDERDVDPDFLEWDLNEWDAYSLEAGLQIREAVGEGEVVAVTVGDDQTEEALLACLAKGADRAVRIWDDDLADSLDTLAVARLLERAVEREQPDLVLCGVQSSDAVNASTGVALAALLDLPRVAVVRRIDYDHGSRSATVERELEGGMVEVLRVRTPALLTVQTGINEPRYANLRAIKQARDKPLEVLAPADLGVDDIAALAGAHVAAMARPPKGQGAEILDGDAGTVAARIASIVKERMA
jgi:electron transfer flavoprotein beta subunit